MSLFLKEPTIEDKEEVIKMCGELEKCGDEYPFEGASRLQKLLDSSYEDWLKMCETDKIVEETHPQYSNGTNYLLVDKKNHAMVFHN